MYKVFMFYLLELRPQSQIVWGQALGYSIVKYVISLNCDQIT